MIAPKIMDFKALVEGVLNSDLLLPYTSDTPGDVMWKRTGGDFIAEL